MIKKSFTIKEILADHWDDFLALGYHLRPSITKNVIKVINCGDPSFGHFLYFCDHCHEFKYVPFRCKSRFCNTCGATYVDERAKSISFKLIKCNHRHLVFTIPEELRIFFIRDRSLLNLLFEASRQTILSWFHSIKKSERFTPGFISTLHTFGRDLKWNPHIHMILTLGASGVNTPWRSINHIPFAMLRRRWQTILLELLHKKLGSSFYALKTKLFYSYFKGFYVYAKYNDKPFTQNFVDYIVRYSGKPAMAQSRILDYDGKYVTFYYDRHEDGKRIVEKLNAIQFIKRLIIHIPEEQFKMVRYYGLYAKKYKHSSKLFLMVSRERKNFIIHHSNWRARYLISFGTDPLKCKCGHTLELVEVFMPSHPSKPPPRLDYIPPPSYNISC